MSIIDPATLSDEQLVERVRTIDIDCYRYVITRYQEKLHRYIMTFVHDHDKAADILQDTFIKAYMNINSFDADRQLSAWLYRIAHNQALDTIKKHKKEVKIDMDWLEEMPDENSDFVRELDQEFSRIQIRKAVLSLPAKYRQVVVLYYFEGHEYEDIGKILKIPVSTVGTRIRRAKSKLKKLLESKELTI